MRGRARRPRFSVVSQSGAESESSAHRGQDGCLVVEHVRRVTVQEDADLTDRLMEQHPRPDTTGASLHTAASADGQGA